MASIDGGGQNWLNTSQVEMVPDFKFRKDSAKTLALIPAKERKRPWIGFDGTSLQQTRKPRENKAILLRTNSTYMKSGKEQLEVNLFL